MKALMIRKYGSPDFLGIQDVEKWTYVFGGEHASAQRAFERALELNPDNEFAKEQLQVLRDETQRQ